MVSDPNSGDTNAPIEFDPSSDEITRVLRRANDGEEGAIEDLFPIVYAALRSKAERIFSSERANHTLQPTALVNEAYLRIVDASQVEWRDSRHFFALASRAMRRVLVDHARKRASAKRGGDRDRVEFDERLVYSSDSFSDLLSLDDALQELAEKSERRATLVELRLFGGLDLEQIGEHLGLAKKTVEADWYLARAWLQKRLASQD